MKFDHVVSRVILDISQPFAACETCGAPVRRDADPTVEWSHMDDENSTPLWKLFNSPLSKDFYLKGKR